MEWWNAIRAEHVPKAFSAKIKITLSPAQEAGTRTMKDNPLANYASQGSYVHETTIRTNVG